MKDSQKVRKYVAAVREIDRLMTLTPTEDYAAEFARNLKAALKVRSELYRNLTGGEMGKARRILGVTR